MEKYYIFKHDPIDGWMYVSHADMDPPDPDVPYPPDPDDPRIPTYEDVEKGVMRSQKRAAESLKASVSQFQKEALGKLATQSRTILQNIKAVYV